MKNRPVAAAGTVETRAPEPEEIPADSRGGVETSKSVQIAALRGPLAPIPAKAQQASPRQGASRQGTPTPPGSPQAPPRAPRTGTAGSAARQRAMEATVRVEVLRPKRGKSRSHKGLFLFAGIVTIAGGLLVAGWGYRTLVAGRDTKDRKGSSRLHHPQRLVFPPGKCPKDMVWVSWKNRGFCIDSYEYPNKKGHRPQVVGDARRAKALCAEAGKRLCTASEWRRACGGPMLLSYPYGDRFNPSKCPVRAKGGPPVPVQVSGSWSECRSTEGVHDMSGNMAEWVSEGLLVGGSGMLTGKDVSCTAQGGAGQPAYYGTRCCLSPAEGKETTR